LDKETPHLIQLSPVHASGKKLILLVFGFFFLINIVSSGGHLDWWDGIEAFLVREYGAKAYSQARSFRPKRKRAQFLRELYAMRFGARYAPLMTIKV
jgi:hypothetical protein